MREAAGDLTETAQTLLRAAHDLRNPFGPVSDVTSEGMVHQVEQHFGEELTGNYQGVDTSFLPDVFTIRFPWHVFDMGKWLGNRWPTSEDFPFEKGVEVRGEYDYRGADAAVDCYIDAVSITPNMTIDSDSIFWQAAAKPFGYLEDPNNSSTRRPPNYFGVVLPAFKHARLIHNNLSSRTGGSRPGSAEHFYTHLPAYLEGGLSAIGGFDCWFCRQLEQWEDPAFRERGSSWLDTNQEAIDRGDACAPIRQYNGGGGGGGSPMGRG